MREGSHCVKINSAGRRTAATLRGVAAWEGARVGGRNLARRGGTLELLYSTAIRPVQGWGWGDSAQAKPQLPLVTAAS